MNVLLTNDDGIDFIGLRALQQVFARNSHRVCIVAPAREKSATSQAMTVHDPLVLKEIEPQTYLLDGFPVDCVNVALHGDIFPLAFDLVISGINKGVNMGYDTLYSGTVGAARHAFLRGYAALAVSLGCTSAEGNFTYAADIVYDFVSKQKELFSHPLLLNMNIPDFQEKQAYDIKWTKLGKRIYRDSYKREAMADKTFLLQLQGEIDASREQAHTDFAAFHEGYISLTPLTLDGTDYEKFKKYHTT